MMNHAGDPLLYLASDYDIREIPEPLYLAVLASRSAEDARAAGDLGDSGGMTQSAAKVRKGQEMG